jgi:hypothetical protein
LPDTRSLSLYLLTRIQRFIIPCNLVYYTATNSNRKKWLKWGYHENCDTSDISTNFQKFFWILEEGWKGYVFYELIFLGAEFMAKSAVVGGGDIEFSWYFTIFNPDYLENKKKR